MSNFKFNNIYLQINFHTSVRIRAREAFERGKHYDRNGKHYEAVVAYQTAASLGHIKAHHYIAVAYANGEGVEKNQELAFEWYSKAIELGFGFSASTLGYRYTIGVKAKRNLKTASLYYHKAALLDHPDGMAEYGALLWHSLTNVSNTSFVDESLVVGKDSVAIREEADRWLLRSVELKSTRGYYLYAGFLVATSVNISDNINTAISLWTLAAQLGKDKDSAISSMILSFIYNYGLYGVERNEVLYAKWERDENDYYDFDLIYSAPLIKFFLNKNEALFQLPIELLTLIAAYTETSAPNIVQAYEFEYFAVLEYNDANYDSAYTLYNRAANLGHTGSEFSSTELLKRRHDISNAITITFDILSTTSILKGIIFVILLMILMMIMPNYNQNEIILSLTVSTLFGVVSTFIY